MDRYKKKINVIGGTMSEKYDGIQGVWDGKVLKTRTNNIINAPAWWLHDLPATPLIGELWTKRNDFSNVQSIVTTQDGSGNWESVKFMIFDWAALPVYHKWPLHCHIVKQVHIESKAHFDQFYMSIITNDGMGGHNGHLPPTGEGIVVTINGHDYKEKPLSNDDGQVVGHEESKINPGITGALIIQLRDGRTMKLSGMKHSLKKNPPAIGTIIEFTHWGRTSTGLPRFAGFHRVRAETNLNF